MERWRDGEGERERESESESERNLSNKQSDDDGRNSQVHRSERRQTSTHHGRVFLKKGVEDVWAIETIVKFIDSFGYR